MRIFNEDKTQELMKSAIDLENGYLKPEKLFIAHHAAVEAKEAVYDTVVKNLDNGSTETYHPLLSPAVEAKEAYDEYEDIQVYVLYTEDEIKERHLTELRSRREQLLNAFDKYKSNVDYGIEREMQTQHENMIAWYEDLLDLKEYAFENVPERIKYYL